MLYSNDGDLIPYICYDIKIFTTALTPSSYTAFQTQLSDLILKLRNKNRTFKQISDELKRRGLKSPRGKTIEATHVFSICKKRLKRDERLNSEPIITIENFSIRYIAV